MSRPRHLPSVWVNFIQPTGRSVLTNEQRVDAGSVIDRRPDTPPSFTRHHSPVTGGKVVSLWEGEDRKQWR